MGYHSHGRKNRNSGVYVKGSTSNEFEVDYYWKLEEVIELQYHSEYNKVFLFKYYCHDIIDGGIKVDLRHDFVKINAKARLRNIDEVFVFAKQ
jgi:hypothetical protein